MDNKRELFEKMPVPKALATLAIPTIISQLISMIYNLADTFFIGLASDPSKTAASSVAFTLLFMLNCLPNLFGVGGGSLISRLMGQKNSKDAAKVSSFAFYWTLIVAAVYALVVLFFMDGLLLRTYIQRKPQRDHQPQNYRAGGSCKGRRYRSARCS